MPEILKTESPLAEFWRKRRSKTNSANPGLRFREYAFLEHLNLRGDPNDPSLQAAIQSALNLSLPKAANTASVSEEVTILWLGPDEWLVVTPEGGEEMVAAALRRAVSEGFAGVVELGSGQTVIEIAGPRAREVIAKGCPLDLHPRMFGPGSCAQSRLARALVTIAQVDGTPTFELIVRRSFADYVWRFLTDACRHPVERRFI